MEASTNHKYALGQAVVFSPGPGEIVATVTSGKVTRLLPKEGAEYQYHIQVGLDGQQRRVQENQLRSATESHARWPRAPEA